MYALVNKLLFKYTLNMMAAAVSEGHLYIRPPTNCSCHLMFNLVLILEVAALNNHRNEHQVGLSADGAGRYDRR